MENTELKHILIAYKSTNIGLQQAHDEILRLFNVVGRSEQLKAFADYTQKRMWEGGDKDLSEFVDEFLRL